MSMSEPFVTKEQITAYQIVDLFKKNNIDWDNLPDRNSDEWKQLYNSFCKIHNVSEEVFEFYITTVQTSILQRLELQRKKEKEIKSEIKIEPKIEKNHIKNKPLFDFNFKK